MADLTLSLGALAQPLAVQLREQGVAVGDVENYQQDADALTRAYVRSLLPPSQVQMARRRLLDRIASEAVPIAPGVLGTEGRQG